MPRLAWVLFFLIATSAIFLWQGQEPAGAASRGEQPIVDASARSDNSQSAANSVQQIPDKTGFAGVLDISETQVRSLQREATIPLPENELMKAQLQEGTKTLEGLIAEHQQVVRKQEFDSLRSPF